MDEVRAHCTAQMRELIRGPDDEQMSEMEDRCWKASIDKCGRAGESQRACYIQACIKAVANLTNDTTLSNGNTYLANAVVSGVEDVSKVATMTPNQLRPDEFAAARTKCFSSTALGESDQFECPRCKARRSVHYELQTRSADEATTIFISCAECGNRWTE